MIGDYRRWRSSLTTAGTKTVTTHYRDRKVNCLAFGILLLLSTLACAQQWPVKPVRVIVPFPPGQAVDIIARLLAERISPSLGQQVLVDNRPGAGTMIGSELAAKSPPDGYTFLAGGTSALAINPHLFPKLGYQTLRDFAPVTNLYSVAYVFCVNPALPVRTIADLVRLAMRRPGEIIYGSGGIGSTAHLAQEMFASTAGVKITHVPYKGSVPALTDLIGGQIALVAETTTTVLPHLTAGRLRGIGVSPAMRVSFLPELATLAEQGIKDYDVTAWGGLVAPAGTPAPILDRMNAEVVKVLNAPEIRKRLVEEMLATPIGDSREEFLVFLKAELAKWGNAVKVSGATVE